MVAARAWKIGEALGAIVVALEVNRTIGEDLLEDGYCLGEAIDPDGTGVVRNADALVLRDVPACTNTDQKTAVAQSV